jgi:putative ABC transport system permease protein
MRPSRVPRSPRRPNRFLHRACPRAAIAVIGLAVGFASGFGLAQLAGAFLADLKAPGALTVGGSALVLLLAAVIASAIPAARAAGVDVIEALRAE